MPYSPSYIPDCPCRACLAERRANEPPVYTFTTPVAPTEYLTYVTTTGTTTMPSFNYQTLTYTASRATFTNESESTMPNTDAPPRITYGVEIECSIPRFGGDPRRRIAEDLRALGIDAVADGYSGRDYSRWQIKSDCSLSPSSGHEGTCEVVSPILTWDDPESERQVKLVSEYLVSIGATANRTCGGHVHMSVGHLSATGLANLVETYAYSQTAIDGLVANHRRVSVNGGAGYARGISTGYRDEAVARFRRGDYNYACDYLGGHSSVINGDWFTQRGTFEFRQRNATVNHYKLLAWVGTLVAMVRAAEDGQALTYDDSDAFTAYLVEGGYLSETLREWVMGRIPRMEISDRLAEARIAARRQVSRLLSLQGV